MLEKKMLENCIYHFSILFLKPLRKYLLGVEVILIRGMVFSASECQWMDNTSW